MPYPIIPGHVSVGVVDKMRGPVHAASGRALHEGDRVGCCGLITAVHVIDRAAIRLADRVLVQGTGAVGLCAIALARLSGASTIVAIGAPADRLSLAARMGATLTLDLTTTTMDERRARVTDVTGARGVDVGIEAAGSPQAFEEGVTLVRDVGAMSSPGTTPTRRTAESMRTSTSIASISRFAAPGAARRATSCAPS